MKAKQGNIIVSIIAGSVLMALPVLTSAKPLTVINSTKSPFTVSVNNNCSNDFGIINKDNSKRVTEDTLVKLCGANASNCSAVIYKSNDCSGKQIGDFLFDAKIGVKDSFHSAKNYSMTVSYGLNWVTLTQAI